MQHLIFIIACHKTCPFIFIIRPAAGVELIFANPYKSVTCDAVSNSAPECSNVNKGRGRSPWLPQICIGLVDRIHADAASIAAKLLALDTEARAVVDEVVDAFLAKQRLRTDGL